MKNTLLFLMLMLSGMAGAQIVNIADAAFKATLLSTNSTNFIARDSNGNAIVLDINNDGEIQVSEALEVTDLFISDAGDAILSMNGIEAFTNLQKIQLYVCNSITSFNYNGLTNLEELYLTSVPALTSVNIANHPNLKKVIIDQSESLVSLNFTGLVSLEEIAVRNCPGLSSVIIPNNLVNLYYVEIVNSYLSSLDCTGMPALETLTVRGCSDFSSLIFGDNTDLKNIDVDFMGTSLDVSGLTGLEIFHYKSLSSLTTSMTLSSMPTLKDLRLDNLVAESVDLSGCTGLTKLYLKMTPAASPVSYCNLKNGVTEYESFGLLLSALPTKKIYLCIDEGNEVLLQAYMLSSPNFLINSYCSFIPGGGYNIIAGDIIFDADNNGCDSNDGNPNFVRMNISNNIESLSLIMSSGEYEFYTRSGVFNVTPQFENNWFTATPPSAIINFAAIDNSTAIQNFCISTDGVHPDVEVVVIPFGAARPGFNASYKIVYRNKGNQTLSGAVTLNYDDSVLDHIESYPVENSSSMGSLTWNYTNLLPFEARTTRVTFNLNGPMEIPAVDIDDVLAFSASVTPVSGDETPADNTFVLNQTVTGSFDPNDITCLEGRSVSPDKIGEYLHYNINFENTGTAPATFIVVKDIIDETKFDISSLQLMDASNAIETRINGNKVEFIFDDINLGPEEKGNVTFKIKTLNTLQVNDDVTQQADIFFDYNWPVQTNEATTTFEVLSRGDFAMDNSVKVYPNPVKSIVTISADSALKSIQLYDIQGRLLQSGTVNDMDATLDLSSRGSGIYFVKVFTEEGIKVEKIVKE